MYMSHTYVVTIVAINITIVVVSVIVYNFEPVVTSK